MANRPKIARMVNRAARYLHRRDPSVPSVRIRPEEVDLLDGYMGSAYAYPIEEASRAAERVARTEGLSLETTYTGKAMAALLDYAEHHPGARLLFIGTFAEAPLLEETLEEGDYRGLPEKFWPVFDRSQQVSCWCLRSWRDPDFCWGRERG